MKLGKNSWRLFILIAVLVAGVIFLLQAKSVKATFSNMHAFTVLLRVQTEIMQKSPAGQYYESLFWKHNDEIMQIMNAHPEHDDELWNVTRIFIPELEALLNGDGDKVYITSEHIENLNAELDWFASVGSPAMREDIQREKQRLSIDNLIGMTMSDALDYINSCWSPDTVASQILVPDSGGKWAYYVHNGVYLEYPSNYFVQISESEKDYVYLIPFEYSPEQWNPRVMKIHVWNFPVIEKDSESSLSWYSPESIVWESAIQTPEFQGVEFASVGSNVLSLDIHAFQYNQEYQLAVDIWVSGYENSPISETTDYIEMINRKYEYFQHMVEHLRIWKP